MDADLKKIKKLTLLMKKEGLLVLKTPEIELHLALSALNLDQDTKYKGEAKDMEAKEFDSESALYWSAPGNIGELEQ